MDIAEMHVYFRQYAQQMGMQNVRAILPEQIDLLINTSISDTINQLIQQNIGITNDRVITDNSKIGQINAFRTLYSVAELMVLPREVNNTPLSMFQLKKSDAKIGKLSTAWIPTLDYTKVEVPDYLFLVDLSINYKPATQGVNGTSPVVFDEDGEITNYFPVRLIDDAYLSDTLNDFVLKPRLRSPIAVVYNKLAADGQGYAGSVLDVYIDKFTNTAAVGQPDSYKLDYGLLPYDLRISYIKKPAKVKYVEDLTSEELNVDCDLPESMHVDIIKHAVDLYRVAVNGSLYASQQAEQQQQRENTRNNYRNEGYNNPRQQQQVQS